MDTHAARPVLWPEIRALLLAAMAVFTYTITIGILNGIDAIEFDQRRILGHVHGGTLGWLTLAVFAASLWLFGEGKPLTQRERMFARWLAVGAIVAFAAYVLAFSLTYGNWRPVLGTISTIVIAGQFLWVLARARGVELGVPHWGFLAALGTSIVGGILGILWGLQLATGDKYLPTDGEGAHPATMVVGFLVPVGLAMSEWAFSFPHPPRATRLGIIQMVFPFAGGVCLMLSILLDIVPLAPIAILLQIAGMGIFIKRMWPHFRSVDLMQPSPGRHALMAAIGLLFVIGLAQYIVIKYEGDFDLAPENQLLALDHSQFIGLMTNSIFAMLMAATIGKRGNRLDQVIFVAVNLGIIGFAAGLLSDATFLKRVSTPVMGAGLYLGLAVYALRLLEIQVAGVLDRPAAQGAPGK
ncbi:MAG: hypothetical protein IPN07_06465 [Dehalococcoidia bacterium]|nr:hypothetical protein [Dehalococcoidia bacterium]